MEPLKLYEGRCPKCKVCLRGSLTAALVCCPNQRGGCGTQWVDAQGRKHWLPTRLRMKLGTKGC